MESFDISSVSLDAGTTLIEASAGTGKTFSITGLIVRLLLEKNISIGEVVAVTFTEAATAELRERTRGRIASALEGLRSGRSDDAVVADILKNGDISAADRKLNVALQSFDEAQIFTIHAFCQRVLNDYAFESGTRFDSNLTADPRALFDEVARDFWRSRFYEARQLLVALVIAWDQSPSNWSNLLQRASRHPDLVILPPSESVSFGTLLTQIEEAFAAVRQEWQTNGKEIERVLRDDPGLSRAQGKFHLNRVAEIVSQLALACENFDCAAPECIGALAHVCSEAIEAGKKGTKAAPAHAFFELCSHFCKAVTALFNQLTHEFFLFAKEELPKRKAQANTITYDDLIIGLRDALRGPEGLALATVVGSHYKAALIDEFQDTDPAQYEIFEMLFGAGHHSLFYIGDPKQSIYGFRGADVFTYREAAEAAKTNAFTLTSNWRSEPALLSALNALFSQTQHPFLFDWIAYHHVQAPEKPKVVPLNGSGGAPLRLRFLKAAEGEKAFTQEAAAERVSAQLAADIAELYAGGARIGGHPLRYVDAAVIVRTNDQAELVQESLRASGIRSVLRTENSVFASAEAGELQRLLLAVLGPRRDGFVRAALATCLFGFDAHKLYDLEIHDESRQEWLDRFSTWRDQWVNGCFIAMFRRVLVEQSVRSRLVKLPWGERRLTNLLQLAELLHEAETSRRLPPDAVCAFLNEQRDDAKTAEEQYQLRLESDEDAVQIITTHKAKGLEYPVVFCPFLWRPAESSKHTDLQFHDRDDNYHLTFDLREKGGGDAKHVQWQSEEVRSEELRLAYVAVTRAMNRCYVYIAETQSILKSPLAHLLGAHEQQSIADRINVLAASSDGAIEAEAIHAPSTPRKRVASPAPTVIEVRKFEGQVRDSAMTTSFSELNHQPPHTPKRETRDEPVMPSASAAGASTIFSFPRGPEAGDFFHDLLEHVDFGNQSELEALTRKKLRFHGFTEPDYTDVISSTIRGLLNVELDSDLRLNSVATSERLTELRFTYPLQHLTPPDLRAVFSESAGVDAPVSELINRLEFSPVEGFMNGAIDLLMRCGDRFYIVDWKSNWLGASGSDYSFPAMSAEMLRHNYYFQYHIYTLAVDLFLKSRLPDYNYEHHFGGVFYIFLRGVDPSKPQQGVFRARPSAQTVSSMHRLLP